MLFDGLLIILLIRPSGLKITRYVYSAVFIFFLLQKVIYSSIKGIKAFISDLIYLFFYSPYLARVTCTERPDFQQGPGFTNNDKNIQKHNIYIKNSKNNTITSTQTSYLPMKDITFYENKITYRLYSINEPICVCNGA